jgi:hypothetical protein
MNHIRNFFINHRLVDMIWYTDQFRDVGSACLPLCDGALDDDQESNHQDQKEGVARYMARYMDLR